MLKQLLFVFLIAFGTAFCSEDITSYLLPQNHEMQIPLAQIFSKSRAILSIETMKKAGFSPVEPRKFTRLIVTSHPSTPGYIYKVYLDAQYYYKGETEKDLWKKRIDGAQLIRNMIASNGWDHLFKVPQKWMYRLPSKPAPPKEFLRKDYILVEEDMDLLSSDENKEAWKNPLFVTEELLDALYQILVEVGLRDCVKIDNIPFSSDGRVAFIDTQSWHEGIPPLSRLTSSLPDSLKPYWKQLIK